MNHIDFIVEFLDIMNRLFDHFKDNKICLISGEPENIADYYPYSNETLKEESAIFRELMNHCISIIIASYGFYKLSAVREAENEQSSLVIDFEEDKKQEGKDDNADKNQDEIITFFNKIGAIEFTKGKKDSLNVENIKKKEELEKHITLWNEKLSENKFMQIALLMIDRSDSNFDDYFTKKSFEKYLFLTSKLLDNDENVGIFYKEGGFKKLLNLKSKQRNIVDVSKGYFQTIVSKLIEDRSTKLSITENLIKK